MMSSFPYRWDLEYSIITFIMRAMPALRLTLMLPPMLMCQQVAALDVRGIHIGDRWDTDRLEQALSYLTVPSAQRVKCRDGEQVCAGTTRFLDADVRLIVEGTDDRVSKITLTLPAAQFESEVTAIKREYGQPVADWSAPDTATAPLLFRRRLDWRLLNEELFALKFSTMATIYLTAPADSVAGQYPAPM
jgi:hypothetical protein